MAVLSVPCLWTRVNDLCCLIPAMHKVGTSRPSWPLSWPWSSAMHFWHLRQRSNFLHSRDFDGQTPGSSIGWKELGQMMHTWSSNMFACVSVSEMPMPLIQWGGVWLLHIEFMPSLCPCHCSQWASWLCGQALSQFFLHTFGKFWSISISHHQRKASPRDTFEFMGFQSDSNHLTCKVLCNAESEPRACLQDCFPGPAVPTGYAIVLVNQRKQSAILRLRIQEAEGASKGAVCIYGSKQFRCMCHQR